MLAGDVRRRHIVADDSASGETPVRLVYDDNDRFNLRGSPTSMAVFEAVLAEALNRDSSGLSLALSNYRPGRGKRAQLSSYSVSLTVPETILDGIDTTVWVWTGREGDEVDRRTELFRLDVEASARARGAVQTEISTRFKGSKAKFGTTVSVTVQLQDAQGRDVSVGVDGERPAEWEFFEEELEETETVNGIREGNEEARGTDSFEDVEVGLQRPRHLLAVRPRLANFDRARDTAEIELFDTNCPRT